jgi:two-component system CheB/CheR fusion protein
MDPKRSSDESKAKSTAARKRVKASKDKQLKNKPFPVVGIGASAGGLEAFTQLLKDLSADTGMAFVLVQHLDPKHESMLTELIARATTMPVTEVKDGMRVKPDHVYVIPPNTYMSISGEVLALTPRSEIPGQHRPVDHFLTSLAEDRGSSAIGVILSGTASDGTLGLKAIKAEGGITFAQDRTAKYDGMPRSAIAAGCVDFILPPGRIARELVRIGRHPYVAPLKTQDVEVLPEGGENDLRRIFRLLLRSTGVDFTDYKHSTIERRIARRMVLQRIERREDYVQYLRDNPGEVEALYGDILITVTGFFRDPGAFLALKQKVFLPITTDRSPETSIRVWVPGCATGEEAYSIAICLLEFLGETATNIPIQIFGTDINEMAIEKARSGIYTKSITTDVSAQRLRRFFVKVDSGYQISKSVRELCVFAKQDLTSDPPFSKLDLISCRNMLIYLGPVLQKRVIPLFHYALKLEGFLLLGKSEALSAYSDLFSLVEGKHKIYSKRAAPARHFFDVVPTHRPAMKEQVGRAFSGPGESGWGELNIQKEADGIVLTRYAPPGVIVNDAMEILQFRGRTGHYLEPEPGEASFNLLKMAREGLKLELRTALHRAKKTNVPVRKEGLRVRYNGEGRHVSVEIVPLKASPAGERVYLVLFEEVTPEAVAEPQEMISAEKAKKPTKSLKDRQMAQLEQELASTRAYLQSIIEEQEATNEELKSANEEVLSSNEELQSINEELETAKEELQSANEELTTINEELQNRNIEMHQLNNDLINLLASVNIPVLMLGSDSSIRRFTPMAEKVMNVVSSDVGRSIHDIRLRVELPHLEQLISEVLDTLSVREREVQDREGRWYSLRVHPYRTTDNKIDGTVLTLVDIDSLKRSQEEIKESRDFAEAIVETVREPLLILDQDLRVERANRSFYETFNVLAEETESRFIYDLGDRQWDIPDLRKLLEEIIARDIEFHDYELTYEFPRIGWRSMLLNARRIHRESSSLQKILLAIEDVTEHKRLEAQFLQSQKMETVGRLAGGVAHEFNNLLTAITTTAELGMMGLQPADPLGIRFQQILRTADRAARLTSQLLAFSRQQIIEPKVIDLSEVLLDTDKMLRRLIGENIELVTFVAEDLSRVKVDPAQIGQVIVNLALNARDAMPKGGRLTIETANVDLDDDYAKRHHLIPPGKYVMLAVSDTGLGMTEEVKRHLFEPFFTTKGVGKGTGLGLSNCYGIVKQSGGDICVDSEPGKGTTFKIYLPRFEEEAEAQPVRDEPGTIPRGTETVLLAEDEPSVLDMAASLLRELGYTVLEATNGEEALRVARENAGKEIHLLLTDVVMPQMGGKALADQLRKEYPDMRMLFMSGYADESIASHDVLGPSTAFLQKPFLSAVLARKIRELLDK